MDVDERRAESLADVRRDAQETVHFLAHYVDFAPRDAGAPTGTWGESPAFFREAARAAPPPWLAALWQDRRRGRGGRRVSRRAAPSSPGS